MNNGQRLSHTAILLNLLLLAINIAIGFFLLSRKIPPAPPPRPAAGAVAVRTAPVLQQDLPEIVEYPGRIEPSTEVRLAAEQTGRIVWLGAGKGDSVTNGQPILRLDDRAQTAALERAEINLLQITDDRRRAGELLKTGAMAQSDFEALERRLALAAVAVREARTDLDKCLIRAPIDAVVADRPVETGEFAAPGALVFTLAAIDRVKVILDLPERDIYAARRDIAVPFEIDALPGRTFKGGLSFAAPVADRRSNTFRVELTADNPDRLLRAGSIARVAFSRGIIRDAVTAPLQALVPQKGEYLAYVVENDRAVRRVVKPGPIVDTRVVILSGLKPGENVIVEGQRLVADGAAIRLTGAER